MCIFCEIIKGNIKSEILFEDDKFIVIKDIEPKAKYHYLAIPKNHYKLLSEQTSADIENLGYILNKIPSLSELLHLENGYRLIINQGEDAGQTVHHLHIHILAGEKLDF